MPRRLSLVAYSGVSYACEPRPLLLRDCRASHPTLYSKLRSRGIAANGTSLRRRFMIERRFRHTSTRGSVAPRRTSNRRFIGDCIHPSLLPRGATEPPDSPHQSPLHVLHVLHGHPLCALCASALKILSPSTRSTCSTRLKPSAHSASLRLCVKNPLPQIPQSLRNLV